MSDNTFLARKAHLLARIEQAETALGEAALDAETGQGDRAAVDASRSTLEERQTALKALEAAHRRSLAALAASAAAADAKARRAALDRVGAALEQRTAAAKIIASSGDKVVEAARKYADANADIIRAAWPFLIARDPGLRKDGVIPFEGIERLIEGASLGIYTGFGGTFAGSDKGLLDYVEKANARIGLVTSAISPDEDDEREAA